MAKYGGTPIPTFCPVICLLLDYNYSGMSGEGYYKQSAAVWNSLGNSKVADSECDLKICRKLMDINTTLHRIV